MGGSPFLNMQQLVREQIGGVRGQGMSCKAASKVKQWMYYDLSTCMLIVHSTRSEEI